MCARLLGYTSGRPVTALRRARLDASWHLGHGLAQILPDICEKAQRA